jgi:hypothetical protein
VTLVRKPRYADVAATLALVLALGGGAYAATSLPAGSVGSKQLIRGAVSPGKLGFPLGLAQTTGTAQPTIFPVVLQSCPPGASCPAPAIKAPEPLLTATVKLSRPSKVLVYGSVSGSASASSNLEVSVGQEDEGPSHTVAQQPVAAHFTIGGATTLNLDEGTQKVSLYAGVTGAAVVLNGQTPTSLTVVALPSLK